MPKRKKNHVENISVRLTDWMGTPTSIIIHTLIFIGAFFLVLVGVSADKIMLALTTAVSLEAIYLSLFIQMSVNRQAKSIAAVEKDIDEIQEDVEVIEDLQDDVQELSHDLDVLEAAEKQEEVGTDADFNKTHTSLATIENHILQVTHNLTNLRTELDALKTAIHSKQS